MQNTTDGSSEEITSSLIQELIMEGGAFALQNDAAEDIYSDDDLKVKY